jgi:Multiubiquitin
MSMSTDVQHDPEHTYTIVVNGQAKPVASREVTYDQVVDLAFPGERSDPNLTFTVTYRQADSAKHDGDLVEGGIVHVKKEGTIFNVTRTTRS